MYSLFFDASTILNNSTPNTRQIRIDLDWKYIEVDLDGNLNLITKSYLKHRMLCIHFTAANWLNHFFRMLAREVYSTGRQARLLYSVKNQKHIPEYNALMGFSIKLVTNRKKNWKVLVFHQQICKNSSWYQGCFLSP